MNNILQKDLADIDFLLEKTKTEGLSFLHHLDQLSTTTDRHKAYSAGDLTQQGSGALQALATFKQRFDPILVASAGPRYWGFVTGGSTPAAIMGDWLTTIYDQNTQTLKGQGDISALIEIETIGMLLQLFDLPPDFFGGFVSGATMSNFTCLAVARQWIGQKMGRDIAKEGVPGGINILTATAHSSAIKSLSMLGLGSQNLTKINCLEGNREAIDPLDLERHILALNGEPFILISSGGTVNTVDFDDFEAIARLHQKYAFWWHIDAAFGGFAACSPQYKHLVNAWETADSITVDCHKWLNVPYESAVFFVKEQHRLLQIETFQNSNAPYLGNPLENFSYLNFLPENSRRLIALPTWFSLMAYGKQGYRDIVENSVNMARYMGDFVRQQPQLELLAPVRLNTVCFTLAGNENQDQVAPFLTALNDSGKVFMTPTAYQGRKGIRAAFVNWRTTRSDVDLVAEEMKKILADLS